MSEKEFEAIVNDFKEEIVKGNIFQIVPSRKYYFDIQGSTLEIYKHLREQNPSPHMFFLKFGERELIGSSPELVARIQGQKVESYPIAGTRSRGATDEEDMQLEKELLSDEKEVAEHMMLVDMARDDLGRVCEYASVKVDKMKVVKKFSHVQHLVSHVSGELMKDKNAFDAVMASFPMGTVSGAPRIAAYKLIQEKEKIPRGPYAGSVGFFSFSGSAVAALPIRSIFIDDNSAYTQAGAGVVYDSIPEFERKEVEKKLGAVKRALGL
ncbi:anthranilate synthase component I family protein [Candidatus Peregrinibacteria bacterium]|nr:anthranilate synthase component I family protein [Candidatus Peregrinibacteria bacterium]